MTIICLRMPTDSLVSGWQGVWMTIICLHVPSDLIVSGLKRKVDDHNLSPHANGLACLWKAKGADDHNLSLRADGLACLWKAKNVQMTIVFEK